MLQLLPYDRDAAVAYAHRWAFERNPEYYDFSELGGDCTNFASQCLFAGTRVMNYSKQFGWYYTSPDDRSPSWAGVPFFWDFMTRSAVTNGPVGVSVQKESLLPGDFVQIKFESSQGVFAHTPIVVSTGKDHSLDRILVAAHSKDSDWRALSSYENVVEMRFLHIVGAIFGGQDGRE